MPHTEEETIEMLGSLEDACNGSTMAYNKNHPGGEPHGGCGMAWDNIMCWNATRPGTIVRRPCPAYICGFNTSSYAERICMSDGTWFINPQTGSTWTNYTSCHSNHSSCQETNNDLSSHVANADNIRLLYTIGYSVSLGSLIIAVIIMLYWKRLHSKSNNLHINLFLAFIMRAAMAFMKDKLFVANLGLPSDVRRTEDKFEFIEGGLHLECRTIYVLFMFAISASQTWILMEGLYLILLIHKTILTERLGVKPYIILGWTLPWSFLIPWIIVKATNENTFCWNFQENPYYFWMLKGPWTSIVLINFFFFIDIIRVLLIRFRNNQIHAGRSQYRKFAKFILVLIPLFGIMYIVMFVAFPKKFHGTEYDVFYLYIEMGYNSFQGFILALLFCFLNEDVHAELRRSWNNKRSRRLNHSLLKRSLARSSWNGAGSGNGSVKSHKTKLSFMSHPRAKNALSWSPTKENSGAEPAAAPLNPRATAPIVIRNSYSSLTTDGRNGIALEKEHLNSNDTADV